MTLDMVKAVIERASVGRTPQTIKSSVGLSFPEVNYIIEQFRRGQNAKQITETMNKKGFKL